jgi:hypothetical protein
MHILTLSLRNIDFISSKYTPSLRKDLPHRRHTQRLRDCGHCVVQHIHCRGECRTYKAFEYPLHITGSDDPIIPYPCHLSYNRVNLASDLSRQTSQRLGNDSPLRRLVLSHPPLGPDIPCNQGPQPESCALESLPTFTACMAPHRCHDGHHISLGISPQSRCPLGSSIQSRRSPMV